MNDMLPCPFCGSERIVKGERYFAMCVDCGATGPERVRENTAARIWKGDWNTRATIGKCSADLQARDKALVEAKWLIAQAHEPHPDPSFYSQTLHNQDWKERRDKTLATINSLLGDKCGVATPPPDNQKGGS